MAVREKELEGYRRDRDWYRTLAESLEQNPTEDSPLYLPLAKAIAERYDRVITCAEEGEPFIAGHRIAAEIFAAMDLPWYMLLQTAFLASEGSGFLANIDECERIGLGTDMCTAVRLSIQHIEAGLMPPPTAITSPLQPCDAAPLLYQTLSRNKRWRDVPHFAFDPPYWEDDRSIDYFAQEFREMVTFLEEQTGRKLDMDRLREVITESNKQYELWAEYNDLRRVVPCPHGFGIGGMQCFAITQIYLTGEPMGTAWYRDLIAHAERRVQEKRGGLPGEERIRVFWFDVMPMGWVFEFAPWLEEEWGANIVMDMLSYAPYSTIDTSSEETIFQGLAKRSLVDMPMVRQARGVADNFIKDIIRVVDDYKVDCVIWPAHMGHKDGSASIGMMREVCREIGVPFLTIGLDLFDPRYTTVDQVKDKIGQFFTVMGLG
jgi:benzoyl-CoA reductase/2-hydroxyglutaryl-CoA dehydratase subunit BcrC/BadD/HgdB